MFRASPDEDEAQKKSESKPILPGIDPEELEKLNREGFLLFVAGPDNKLYILNAKTGEQLPFQEERSLAQRITPYGHNLGLLSVEERPGAPVGSVAGSSNLLNLAKASFTASAERRHQAAANDQVEDEKPPPVELKVASGKYGSVAQEESKLDRFIRRLFGVPDKLTNE